MTLRGATRIAVLGLAALACYAAISARRFGIRSDLGPGAGFFPFILGLALAGLALVWLARDLLARDGSVAQDWPEGPPPRGAAALRLLGLMALLVVCAVMLPRLGFALTVFLLVAVLLPLLAELRVAVVLSAALVAGPGLHTLFVRVLGVDLPVLAYAMGGP